MVKRSRLRIQGTPVHKAGEKRLHKIVDVKAKELSKHTGVSAKSLKDKFFREYDKLPLEIKSILQLGGLGSAVGFVYTANVVTALMIAGASAAVGGFLDWRKKEVRKIHELEASKRRLVMRRQYEAQKVKAE